MVNLGQIVTETEAEHFKGKGPLPEDWYKTAAFVSNKEEEPTPYRLLFDWLIGSGLGGFGDMMSGGSGTTIGSVAPMIMKIMPLFTSLPPMSILIETLHPVRDREHVRISTSPFGIHDGAPKPGYNLEPDIIMRIDYYDLVRIILGEMSFADPLCDGLATIEGNLFSFMTFGDMFDTMAQLFSTMGGGEGGDEGGLGGIMGMVGGPKK